MTDEHLKGGTVVARIDAEPAKSALEEIQRQTEQITGTDEPQEIEHQTEQTTSFVMPHFKP